ncbi:MAG: FAD-dependent oxidoreductase [SAR324 cluster bacterium]|nr:FAD-dependent oxidoreductase [SAR324 cluster bacterium]
MKHRPSVGIIGGGIFGISCALHLDNTHDVSIFEQGSEILMGATYANHNRHHYGFHYPRSLETAEQCLASRASFEDIYGPCLVLNFDNYYCVGSEGSKTSPEEYIAFCEQAGLEYQEQWPQEGVLDESKIDLCLKVKEGVYDFEVLKSLVWKRLKATSTVEVKLRNKAIGGCILPSGNKIIEVQNEDGTQEHEFDFVINAMYANLNQFSEWFDFEKRWFQFNLQELDVIELPINRRIGVTIQDGVYPSFLPLGQTNRYLLAHVEVSQLIREKSWGTVPLLSRVPYVESNWEEVKNTCAQWIPLLHQATYIRSLFVDRVVDAARLENDDRISDIIYYGSGCWSIFSAKIITCESIGKQVAAQIREEG